MESFIAIATVAAIASRRGQSESAKGASRSGERRSISATRAAPA